MSVSSFQMHAQILPLSHEKQGADKKSIYLGRRIAKQVSFSSEERLISCLLYTSMPYSGGLQRNIVQCLDDFGIPLKLSTTVVDIHGKERVEGVTLAKVDEKRKPIPGTEEYIPCDCLLYTSTRGRFRELLRVPL